MPPATAMTVPVSSDGEHEQHGSQPVDVDAERGGRLVAGEQGVEPPAEEGEHGGAAEHDRATSGQLVPLGAGDAAEHPEHHGAQLGRGGPQLDEAGRRQEDVADRDAGQHQPGRGQAAAPLAEGEDQAAGGERAEEGRADTPSPPSEVPRPG